MQPSAQPSQTWFFVRHGQTEWNAEMRMQGQWDSRLTQLGREQADANGRFLARQGVAALHASPLGRVRETAAIIGRHVDLPVAYDDRLMEWSSGDWSGYLYAELKEKWPVEWAAWVADRHGYRPPGGENYLDLMARGGAFLEAVRHASPGPVAVLAHGFINRALVACLCDLPRETMMSIRQNNDVVIRVDLEDGAPRLSHYAGGEGPLPGLPLQA